MSQAELMMDIQKGAITAHRNHQSKVKCGACELFPIRDERIE